MGQSAPIEMTSVCPIYLHQHLKKCYIHVCNKLYVMYMLTEYHMPSGNMSADF